MEGRQLQTGQGCEGAGQRLTRRQRRQPQSNACQTQRESNLTAALTHDIGHGSAVKQAWGGGQSFPVPLLLLTHWTACPVLPPCLTICSSHPVRQRSRTRTVPQAVRHCVPLPASPFSRKPPNTILSHRLPHVQLDPASTHSPANAGPPATQPEMTIF